MVKPHDAIIKGSDNIPAPIVVPIIKKTEPIDLEFIYQLYFLLNAMNNNAILITKQHNADFYNEIFLLITLN